jgi:NAD(P)H-hydrate epimerase
MIPIFTTSQIKELDQHIIDYEPIKPVDLVERAAMAFVHAFCRHFSQQNRIFVFAGQGNNGADALAIARLLADESYKVEVYFFNVTPNLSPECECNRQRLLKKEEVGFHEITGAFTTPELEKRDIVIDGLFGSGLNRPLTGGYAAVVDFINQSEATVVAVDIPSGLFGEDNGDNDMKAVIRADATFTFGFPKLTFLLPENAAYVGKWDILDIGVPAEAMAGMETSYALVTPEVISSIIQPRGRFSHKGTYGHALLVAGSRGKMGAALLAARACLRTGAGLLTVHIPQRGEPIFHTAFPEAILSFDPHMERFTYEPDTSPYSAVAVGPGLGLGMDTSAAFERMMGRCKTPMVIDADSINMLASNPDLFIKIPPHSILTPHPKEFDHLAGKSANSYIRLQKALEFAVNYNIYVILKGAYTATCTPAGKVYFNDSGNPGMATAGSGDVLTGILLGLLAQGYPPEKAALLGVYLHGTAGDLASAAYSEESMIAGDITDMLGKAFKQLR